MNINNTADLRTLITLLSSRTPAVMLRGVDTLLDARCFGQEFFPLRGRDRCRHHAGPHRRLKPQVVAASRLRVNHD
jgi:hypothetical protein